MFNTRNGGTMHHVRNCWVGVKCKHFIGSHRASGSAGGKIDNASGQGVCHERCSQCISNNLSILIAGHVRLSVSSKH